MEQKKSKWSDSFYTGILWQDYQHKVLLQKLLLLQGAIKQDMGEDVIDETINFLDHFVKDHFGLEESYMKELKYPGHELHKQSHDSFIEKLEEMKKIQEPSGKVSAETLSLELQKWIIEHITKLDKGFGEFMKTAGVR